MMDRKINLLNSELERPLRPLRPYRQPPAKPFKTMAFVLIFLATVYFIFAFNQTPEEKSAPWYYKLPVVSQIRHLVESADSTLKGQDRDRINILLLGVGGRGHDGGLLTDSIILASYQPSQKKVSLISIPRDLAVPVENMGWRKINNINAFAEAKQPGTGGLALSQTVSDIFKTPIDYYFTVDFTGFEKVIDDLGGITVNVDNTLDDYKYPILGAEEAVWDQRWEHLHIEKGQQTMDGKLALKYVRSRHGLGVEGTDFARARRQQKVLEAVKEKVMSINFLFKPGTLTKIVNDIADNYQTNLKVWEMVKFWNLVKDIKSENIFSRVLDNSPSGLLLDAKGEDGAYLLMPRSGDFSEIQYLISNIFSDAPKTDSEKVKAEKATIEVRNGTWINGLASQYALDLEKYGFTVARVGNTSQQNFEKTVIYDLTYGEKIQALKILKNRTNANVSLGMPQWLIDDLTKEIKNEANPVQPDFIIILGRDADPGRSGAANPEL